MEISTIGQCHQMSQACFSAGRANSVLGNVTLFLKAR